MQVLTDKVKDGIRKVGILIEDGPRGGRYPHFNVFEIADIDAKRSTRDLLPYLQRLRMMFTPLPDQAARVKSGITQVSLDDVEAVTQTLVKVRGPHWYIKIPKGTVILTICSLGRVAAVTKFAPSSKAIRGRRVCRCLLVVGLVCLGRARVEQSV